MQLLGTGKQRASKASRILIGGLGGLPLTYASWSAAHTYEDFSTVNFESFNVAQGETFDEGIGGTLGCDVKFGGDWDAGKNPYDSPPGLYPRDDLANVLFVTNRLDAVFWSFPYIRLRSSTNGAQMGQKVSFDCGGKNQGVFTEPTGNG